MKFTASRFRGAGRRFPVACDCRPPDNGSDSANISIQGTRKTQPASKHKPILAESQCQFVLCLVQNLPLNIPKLAIRLQKAKLNFFAAANCWSWHGLSYRHSCGS